MTPRTDPQLLERVAAGDTGAVREVIDRYAGLVWSLARRFTASEADAEEAVQEIFFQLWRKADRYDREAGREVTFVSLVARRQLIDRWRREKRREEAVAFDTQAVQPDRAAALEDDELAREAMKAYQTLDHDAQRLLRLSIERGRSHAQIAELTGLPLGTVKTKIRTALRRVREAVLRTQEGGSAA
ncbi:MAG: sigma-70 family RNA polymerase sigma factor [Phycisphaerales bacterium]